MRVAVQSRKHANSSSTSSFCSCKTWKNTLLLLLSHGRNKSITKVIATTTHTHSLSLYLYNIKKYSRAAAAAVTANITTDSVRAEAHTHTQMMDDGTSQGRRQSLLLPYLLLSRQNGTQSFKSLIFLILRKNNNNNKNVFLLVFSIVCIHLTTKLCQSSSTGGRALTFLSLENLFNSVCVCAVEWKLLKDKKKKKKQMVRPRCNCVQHLLPAKKGKEKGED